MTRRFTIMAGIVLLSGGLYATLPPLPTPLWAAPGEDKPATGDDERAAAKSSYEADAVADIVLAYQVADWARRMDPPSPTALVTSAEILDRITLFDGTDPKYKGRVTAPATAEKQDPRLIFPGEVMKMLDEAAKMAKTNKQDEATVKAMCGCVRDRCGGLNGPLTFTMAPRAGQTDAYTFAYKKGQWARIAVHHPEEGTVSLEVTNSHGDTIAKNVQRNPMVEFVPRQVDGSDFKVTVTNKGKDTIAYRLFTN